MKRVSFSVAKALKEAGYPQRNTEIGTSLWYTENGEFTDGCLKDRYVVCPNYLDAWLWLWREKKIHLNTDTTRKDIVCIYWDSTIIHKIKDMKIADPEEAIEKAIEYLVEDKLLK